MTSFGKASHTLAGSILLILVVVASGLAIYHYVSSVSTSSEQDKTSANPLIIENYMQSGTCGYVFVRNVGNKPILLDKPTLFIYKDKALVKEVHRPDTITINPNELKIICFDLTQFTADEDTWGKYSIKLSSATGATDVYTNAVIERNNNPPPVANCGLNNTFNKVLYDIDGDGTIDGEADNITMAIQQVANNGIIYVLPGIYTEDLSIYKPLKMYTAGCGNQWIINGTITVFLFNKSHTVTISGFTISPEKTGIGSVLQLRGDGNAIITNNRIEYINQTSGSESYPGALWIEMEGVILVKHNTFIGSYSATVTGVNSLLKILGPYGGPTDYVYIIDNNFMGYGATPKMEGIFSVYTTRPVRITGNHFENLNAGIDLRPGINTIVSKNTIEDTDTGILLDKWLTSQPYNIVIEDNTIHIPPGAIGINVISDYFSHSIIKNNILTGFITSGTGIRLFPSRYSDNITISNNNIKDINLAMNLGEFRNIYVKDNVINHIIYGIHFYSTIKGNIQITGNLVDQVLDSAVRTNGAAYSNITITNNILKGATGASSASGIVIETAVNNLTIVGNEISNFKGIYGGIYFKAPITTPSTSNNILMIEGNQLINNGINNAIYSQIKLWLETSYVNSSLIKINDNKIEFKDVTTTKFVYIYDEKGISNGNPLDLTNNKWIINDTEINDRNVFKNYVCDHENPCDTYTTSYGGYINTGFYITT